jgi:hypothetical protein
VVFLIPTIAGADFLLQLSNERIMVPPNL